MHRNETQRGQRRRQGAERDAAQPIGGQPRAEDDEDALEEPEKAPSFLTARELQAKAAPKNENDAGPADESPSKDERKPGR